MNIGPWLQAIIDRYWKGQEARDKEAELLPEPLTGANPYCLQPICEQPICEQPTLPPLED